MSASDKRLELYRNMMMELGQMTCATFWWSLGEPNGPGDTILNNGTICYVDTGIRKIGVTANHVYETYIRALQKHGDRIECQFGSNTIYPERHVIGESKRWDIATFDVPEVFVHAGMKKPKTHHSALKWPPVKVKPGDPLLYGGYPEKLRRAMGSEAELPFQWVVGRATDDTDDEHIYMKPDFGEMNWVGPDRNYDPSGWSGGPVFRGVENEIITRLELVGFIYAFVGEEDVVARHADVVIADGQIR